ncbi:hypothetical protein HU200_055638 [Digitaria exilis]|uniref:Uncharacterized protein n=1 Tax=Digitaria exilis TaxID=1010633 RepID=A0A835E6I2_9POAL|nr:hypothetical protein HU200_055638 [Digitaria exilis]
MEISLFFQYSAKLKNVTAPNEIPADTIHRTLRAYAEILVQTADDAYNRRVGIETITSFLDALRGMAYVAHILLDDALEALSHEHPIESLSEYALNRDVEIMQHEYNRRMHELQDDINNVAAVYHTHEVVSNTIHHAIEATKSIVRLMMARRERALGKSNGKVV